MATWIPNQPVFFGDINTCSSDEVTINQIVDNTDTNQVQFNIEPCISAQEEMSDPNFSSGSSWNLDRNWSIADNLLCCSGTGLTESSSTTQLDATKYYQVTIIVESISVGGSFQIRLGSEVVGYITTAGTYTFYGFPTSFLGDTGVFIATQIADSEICISTVSAYEILTNFIFNIYNSDGVLQETIAYSVNPEYFVFAQDTVTFTINWAELGISNGCYYVCLADPCINTNAQNYPAVITNGDFTGGASGWTLGNHWTYSANTVVAVYSVGIKGSNEISQSNVFNSFTTTFCIEIVISAGAGVIDVSFGTEVVGTISGAGTHTVSGICTSNFDLTLAIKSGTATVDSVSACRVTDYTCDLTSNFFSLQDTTGACTILINACNNENGLGFNFTDSGFSPRIRLEAKLKQSKYSNERTIQEDSLGTKGVVYFNGKKAKQLAIDLQPEYVHDFLRLLLGFDNVYLDGELYFIDDDEYNVEYSDVSDDLGKVKLLVSKRTQNIKNINCSDTQNVCNLGDDYLLQADDLSQYITLVNGELILING